MLRTALLAAVASLSFASLAHAGNNNNGNGCRVNCPPSELPTNVTNTNIPVNLNVNAPTFNVDPSATALSGAVAASKASSSASSSSTLNGAVQGSVDAQINPTISGSVAPVFNGPQVAITNPKQFRDAPDVGAPVVINVAPCALADGASVSFPGGGANLTKSRESESCNRRADAAMLFALGEKEAAVARMYGHDNAGAIDIGRGRR